MKAFNYTMMLAALVMAALILSADAAFAQPALPNFGGENSQAPLGGLGVLALAGGAYAIRKLKKACSQVNL